jgi:endonuclease YncB( thermonuclease family)
VIAVATVVRIIDGDTIVVHPEIYRQDINLRVRFKDVFAPERGEEGFVAATTQIERMFPVGSKVVLTNHRIRWTHERLEARVDTA